MPKEISLTIKVCNFILKYSVFALVFLMPILFLPWTSDVLELNKQMVLLVLGLLAFFSYMLMALMQRRITINLSRINVAVVVFLLVYLLSALFSNWIYGSFWGWPQAVSESFISLMALCLFYFLVSSFFSKKDLLNLLIILCVSIFVSLIYGFFQAIGLYLIPFNFAKSSAFNTVGSVGILGILAIAILPIALILLAKKKSLSIALFWFLAFLTAFLVVINYSVLWWLIAIASALFLVFAMYKKDVLDSRWLILPMFFLALALFFIVLRPSIGIGSSPVEIFLNQKTSVGIAWQAIKENPIFGSGPGTFSQDFLKYKTVEFNNGNPFWNVIFTSGASKVLTIVTTTGILGFLSFLFLIGYAIFEGIKFFIASFKNKTESGDWLLAGASFIGLLVVCVSFFIHNSNIVLDFLFFLLLAIFALIVPKDRRTYEFETSSLTALGFTFALTLCFIFGLGLFIMFGQKYIAEADYNAALSATNLDASTLSLAKAASLNPSSDLYFRQLSQAYLAKIQQELNSQEGTQEEKSKNIQLFVANTINAAKIASDINPKNISNFANRAAVYQSLIGLVPDSENWAVQMYDEAIKLDPNNPYYPAQKGIVYMTQALSLAENKKADKPKFLAQAKEELDKAIKLKSDYATARFQMAMISQAEGKIDEAISKLNDLQKDTPNDAGLAFQLGLLYYQQKDYSDAQRQFTVATNIMPNYSNALYFSGLTYYKQGDKASAIEKILKVIELNPDDSTVKKVLDNLKAGKDPLEGIGQTAAPIEEKPKEK